MKRPTTVVVIALLILAALVGGLWISGEPTQDGKPVSYWISELGTGPQGIGEITLDKMDPAKVSTYLVRTIGKKQQKESAWDRFYRVHYTQIPVVIRQRLSNPNQDDWSHEQNFIREKASEYLSLLATKRSVSPAKIVPRLVSYLDDSDSDIRFWAANALEGFGTNAAPAVPVIERQLKNTPGKVCSAMLLLLENCKAVVTIPTLKNCLNGKLPGVRINCAKALWVLDQSQTNLVRPVAMELSADKDAGIRIESATLLWRMDKTPEAVVPVLIGLLKDDTHPYNFRSILLLKQIGPGAKEAIPALTNWLARNRTKTEPFVLTAANKALDAMAGSLAANSTNLPPKSVN